MNLWKIHQKYLEKKPLLAILTCISLGFSCMLLLGVQQLKTSFEQQFKANVGTIDMVVGAKGSPLQLVLSSLLHIDTPTGNISWQEAQKLAKNPLVKSSIPLAFGDNYKGYRIVGTDTSFFENYKLLLNEGRRPERSLEIVVGVEAAKKLHLKVGSLVTSTHGLINEGLETHEEKFRVVGILAPTHTRIDHLLLTSIQSIWELHHHEKPRLAGAEEHLHNEEHEHEDEHRGDSSEPTREITALLVQFKRPLALLTLPRNINQQTNMMAALPKYELDKFYNYLGLGMQTIRAIALVILVIALVTLFVSLYKMGRERSYDYALFRSYGASHFQLFLLLVFEVFTIVILGGMLGYIGFRLLPICIGIFQKTPNFDTWLLPLNSSVLIQFILLLLGIGITSILLAIYPILNLNVSKLLKDE